MCQSAVTVAFPGAVEQSGRTFNAVSKLSRKDKATSASKGRASRDAQTSDVSRGNRGESAAKRHIEHEAMSLGSHYQHHPGRDSSGTWTASQRHDWNQQICEQRRGACSLISRPVSTRS